MHTLLNFFIKHNHWFLFLLLEGIGVMLIVQFNNYQNAKMFTSANSVAGNLFAAITDVNSYFALKSENARLLQYNKELNGQVTALKARLAQHRDSAMVATLPHKANGFFYNSATVVNNALNAVNNYITIDKGTADGVEAEMGVFCNEGVVGIIYTASEHYSVVIPLLNSKSSISCRVKEATASAPCNGMAATPATHTRGPAPLHQIRNRRHRCHQRFLIHLPRRYSRGNN